MTRRITGAEARELLAIVENDAATIDCALALAALKAAAPDLAASLAAVEAERDALREKVRSYLRVLAVLPGATDEDDYDAALDALREAAK